MPYARFYLIGKKRFISQLTDIKNENISINNLPKIPSGKKIKDIEITIKVASNNQKQKQN